MQAGDGRYASVLGDLCVGCSLVCAESSPGYERWVVGRCTQPISVQAVQKRLGCGTRATVTAQSTTTYVVEFRNKLLWTADKTSRAFVTAALLVVLSSVANEIYFRHMIAR